MVSNDDKPVIEDNLAAALDNARKSGYHDGYLHAIEDVITVIRVRMIEPGYTTATKSAFTALCSECRLLQITQTKSDDRIG